MQGTSTGTFRLTNSFFSNNFTQGAQLSAIDSASLTTTVTSSTFTNNNEGLVCNHSGGSDLTCTVGGDLASQGNTFQGEPAEVDSGALIVASTGSTGTAGASQTTKIKNNNVTAPANMVNHSIIAFMSGTNTPGSVNISNNIVNHVTFGHAIFVDTPDNNASPQFSVTANNNAVTNNAPGGHGVLVQARQNSTACVLIQNNTGTVAAGSSVARIRQNAAAGQNSTINLKQGVSASGVATQVMIDNNPGVATSVAGPTNGAINVVANGACATPPQLPEFENVAAASAADTTSDGGAAVTDERLRVFGDERPDDGQVNRLSQTELNWMVQAALARWRETGIAPEDLARLEAATLEIANLPSGLIATGNSTSIKIDETAAGYGWYFDEFPMEDSEFEVLVPNRELQTTDLSIAHGKIDLLTVVMRELGGEYLKDRKRTPERLRPLMEAMLSPAVRRLPDASAIGSIVLEPPSISLPVANAPSSSGAASSSSTSQGAGATVSQQSSVSGKSVKPSGPQSGETINLGPFTLPPGEKIVIMFSATVNAANTFPPGTTQVCNQGSVSATGIPAFLTNDPDTAAPNDPTCTPLNVADVSVTKSAGASPVCSTSNFTFTINYTNAGPAAALNAVVSDAMPVGTSLVSVTTPATWTRTDVVPAGGNGTITFSKASSPNADAAVFTIVVSIDPSVADGAVIQNTASVTSTTPDPNTANNTSAPTSTAVKKPPTTATVGGPQTICALGTTTSLGGNTPVIGTGLWTVQSGGTGTFNPNATTPGATFTHLTGVGPIVLRWTISNPPCPDSFAEVTVTVSQQPTATAGVPQTICALGTTASLGGNTPSGGAAGTWTIVTAGVTGTFNPTASTPGATFTHTSGGIGATITLRWTVSNPPCTDATADVAITIKSQPTATVGGPQTICATGTTAGLGGNTPAAGETGTWSIVTAGVIGTFNPTVNTPNATFTHATGTGPFTLRWTVSNPPCTNATADVVITLLPAPVATTGGPQTICELGTTASLGGNTPAAGETGAWSIVTAGVAGTFNPTVNTPGATFTHTSGGAGGTITLRWTVTNPTCGQSAQADAIITVRQQPTATVGGPQTICALGTTAGLGGNTPTGGATGTWTIVTAGATGTFNPTANTPNATFTHTAGTGAITLRWTVSNAPCTDAFAEVIVTVNQQPTATAGGPQTICALGTTAGLGGNTPSGGATGTWTIVTAGATGTFNPNANTPNATFTHATGTGAITLRWTVANPPCPNATADVAITITQPPTTATVGPNQTIVPGGTTAGLGGNTPSSGTGLWSIVTAGATGTFNPNASTPNATWTHVTGSGQVVLRWTITNPPCPASFAEVTIQIGIPPTITCPASPVVANTAPGHCSATVTFVVTATGVPNPTVTCVPPSGSVFQKGDTTVNCTASNGVPPDATCSFTVTVNDTEPPAITCPSNITQSTDPNQCSAVVTYPAPTVTDNCPCNGSGPAKKKKGKLGQACVAVCTPPSGSTFPKGTTTVNCTVSDTSGNQSTCSFTVTVNDTQAPSITCPANITRSTDPNLCSAVVAYPAPVVSDNCPGVGAPVCNPPSGATFPKGTTTVSCTVSDASGNQASCSFTVTVNDTQPSSITCPANITTQTPNPGDACVVVNYPPPVFGDNCPGATVVCTPPSGSCFPLGTTTVTCTATDMSGNTATCTFKVKVFDLCLQDDSNPNTVLLINSTTGDYLFCCNGVIFTGKGKMQIQGSTFKLTHTPSDRRVLATVDESSHKGTASIQAPPGTTRCTITDRNTQNNGCVCQ